MSLPPTRCVVPTRRSKVCALLSTVRFAHSDRSQSQLCPYITHPFARLLTHLAPSTSSHPTRSLTPSRRCPSPRRAPCFRRRLRRLQQLKLNNNCLQSPIPGSLGKLRNLSWLRLEENAFDVLEVVPRTSDIHDGSWLQRRARKAREEQQREERQREERQGGGGGGDGWKGEGRRTGESDGRLLGDNHWGRRLPRTEPPKHGQPQPRRAEGHIDNHYATSLVRSRSMLHRVGGGGSGVEAGNTGTSKGGMVVGGGGASPNIRRVATTVGVVEGRHYQGGVGGGERAESNTTPAYHLHDHQVQHGVHHDVEVRESGDETDLLNARVLYIGYRRPTPIHPPHTHTLTPSHHHTRTREHT